MAITDPTDITGCVLWLDPGSLTESDGDPIPSWTDSSAQSNTATASGADRPTFRDGTAYHHGNPSVEFTDQGHRLTISADTSLENAQVTYAVVIRQDDLRGSTGSGDPKWICNKRNTNPATVGLRATDDGVSNEGRYENFWRLDGSEGTVRTNASRGAQRQAWTVLLFRYDGTDGELYVDKDLSDSLSVSGGIDTDNTNTLTIGNHPTVDFGWAGQIGDFVVYDNSISNTDRDDLIDFLLAKYPNSEFVKTSSVLSTGIRHVRIQSADQTGLSTNQMLVVTDAGAIDHYTSPTTDPHNWTLANSSVIATDANYRTLEFLVVSGTWYVYVDRATGFGALELFTGAAVTSLTEHGSSPVITGSSGDYQRIPTVIEESGSWTMLIDVRTNAILGGAGHIDRWTSSDGVSWSKDTGNSPILSSTGNGFEHSDVGHPYIHKLGASDYLIAYAGFNNVHSLGGVLFPHEIGLLTSTDLISFTRSDKNPALTHSDGASAFDQAFVANPCFYNDGSNITLYYTGATTGLTNQPGYATGGLVGDPTFNINQTIISQTMDLANIVRLAANRVFFFGAHAPGGQEATHNYIELDITNTFTFASVTGDDKELDIIQYLGFTDRFFAPDLNNSLRLRQGEKVSRVIEVSVSNNFNWIPHDAPLFEALMISHIVSNSLGFTDSIIGGAELDVFNDFTFTAVIDSAASTYARSPTHSVIQQHLTYEISGSTDCDTTKEYTPFVGESGDTSFPIVPETPPTLGTNTLSLLYTIASPFQQHQVTLRNPDFGNRDTLRFAKIDRRTLGGTRKIFADLNWPETQTLSLSIRDIDKDVNCGVTIDALINFLNLSLGKLIVLTDWENRKWDGVIITEETEFLEEQNGLSFNMVFEGILQ